MKNKKPSVLFKMIKALIRFFYPKMKIVGSENLPADPCIIVGNHAQTNGPICAELYIPGPHYTWCAGQMMKTKEVPGYAFEDFWSRKPKWTHPWYKLLSYLIAPLAACIFSNANTIAVYRDARIVSTFKATVKGLQEGNRIVIFPEHDVKHNHIVYDFQDKFIDVAKLYYRKTGQKVCFVPLYIAPKLQQMHFGKPIRYDPGEAMDIQRRKICDYLMQEITDIAVSLPEHTVVPYRNIPKKFYPTNIPEEKNHAIPSC